MLEATIGLNELEQQPTTGLELPGNDSPAGGDTFTAQDLNFLKSLRIAIEEPEDHR